MPVSQSLLSRTQRQTPAADVLQYLVSPNGSFTYEVMMMGEALKRWQALESLRIANGCVSNDETISSNRSIEVFLTHFRNLRDFFYPAEEVWSKQKWFDNAVAWDYCPQWDCIAGEWKELSNCERERINKLLSHISYSRPALDHDWSAMPKMKRAILQDLNKLVGMLAPERKAWFEWMQLG